MRKSFDTTIYEGSHGKLPRGEGMWIFSIRNRRGRRELYFAPYGTLTAAKTHAKEFFKNSSADIIHIMP
jgi:hypothetical protein